LTPDEIGHIQRRHDEVYRQILPERRLLPGAVDLPASLRSNGIAHAIATSGRRPEIDASLVALNVPDDMDAVERGEVPRAKPDPASFLRAAERLALPPADCYVVGDAVWDLLAARRAGMLAIGVLSGDCGEDELIRAGAYRVYRDAADLHRSRANSVSIRNRHARFRQPRRDRRG
jgi:HAD superfamily hydrolase (TIGR01509 family)